MAEHLAFQIIIYCHQVLEVNTQATPEYVVPKSIAMMSVFGCGGPAFELEADADVVADAFPAGPAEVCLPAPPIPPLRLNFLGMTAI